MWCLVFRNDNATEPYLEVRRLACGAHTEDDRGGVAVCFDLLGDLRVGFGRIVVLETEAPNRLANLV